MVGQELGEEGWKTIHSAPDTSVSKDAKIEISDDTIRETVRDGILQMAEDMVVAAGYPAISKAQLYGALLRHVRDKFLNGLSLGLSERSDLEFAWRMLPQVRNRISTVPGLVAGVVEYGD